MRERLVLPSQIMNLPDLQGYLSLAGHYPISLVQLTPLNIEPKASPFEEVLEQEHQAHA